MDFWDFTLKVVSPILTFFAGRAMKNREFMSADLQARTQEFRELLADIAAGAIEYWKSDYDPATEANADDLTAKLHRLLRLRVYCSDAAVGYKSSYFRDRETAFADAVSGGDFQSKVRKADAKRRTLIRNISIDIDFAALEARRADFFLIPTAKIAWWWNKTVMRRH